MRILITAILMLLAVVAQAATPTFGDFSSNQFRTNGNKVYVKPTPLLTNIYNDGNMVVRGSLTNTEVVNAGVFQTDDENSSILGTAGRLEINVGSSAVTVFGTGGVGTGHILALDYSSGGGIYTRMPSNAPADGQVITAAGTAGYTKWAAGGGGGTPGGADREIQFNNAGAFDGDSTLQLEAGTGNLIVPGTIETIGNLVISPAGNLTLGNNGQTAIEMNTGGTDINDQSSTTVMTGVSGRADFPAHLSATNNNVISPLLGTTAADNAPAGTWGQFLTNTLASGSAVSLTTATTANITSISLTAGDWQVFGTVAFNPDTTTTTTYMKAGISTTSATLGAQGSFTSLPVAIADNAEDAVVPTPFVHVNVSATTTVYLVGRAAFAASTMTGYGQIIAWRVR